METIQKIDIFGIQRLNNAEYLNFINRVYRLTLIATAEKLSLTEADLAAVLAKIDLLTDIVNESNISDETAQIAEVDSQEDAVIVFINDTIAKARKLPIAAMQEAGNALYNRMKPYVSIQTLPQGQQVQEVRGMLTDLGKADVVAHVATLGLTSSVAELRTLNERYAALLDSRAASQVAAKLGSAKSVRREIDDMYDYIVTRAQAASIITPSAEATAFVTAMNKLIADTRTAYNQRIAQTKDPEEKK